MINIGVRAHDFGKMEAPELSDRIGKFGFSSIQLALKKAIAGFDEDHGRLSPGLGNYFRDSFARNRIDISVLGCYINPVHPDRLEREKAISRFKEHLLFSRDFGCAIVGTETGSPNPDCSFTEDIYKEETFQDFIAALKVLVAAAEKTGAIVAIEGVADKHTIHSHERMKRTLELIPSPNLGVIYDPVNFLPAAQSGESDRLMEEAFELFAHKMVAIHAKDFKMDDGIKNGTLPAGQGELNYHLLFDLIRHYKPWIHVLLENNRPETLRESLRFLDSVKEDLK
ncbi:sugar phosphate isomerase/epimerase family protein [Spirochaeta isovalerica]|uniref:Sugar phosphate isomerase/epimerase n=1 Tax=Spirochaeta isovalerica TaxID=150 RepID=A0A841RC11_9SPIO|nr:sugar phosphate isomerase/epimerase family protein [Spirochaeta isovalerica]MBB6481226.1 sugar phosphate isomerase/epimerase [Spirochaeta isovalerica]